MRNYLRNATRKNNEPLNILTFPTHERYESGLAKTGHNFYAYRGEGIKGWNHKFAELPQNYTLLNPELGEKQVPSYIDFDLVLSQNKFGQFAVASHFAQKLNIPLISLEHTLPVPQWDSSIRKKMIEMQGDINVFISEYSKNKWGYNDVEESYVIKHMVDQETFFPLSLKRENHILSVVNDWVNRDLFCNFSGWTRITRGLPVFPVGDTQGLSKAAKNTEELNNFYNTSSIFINTSTISPIPSALLEAMACGCAVVSTATCMIPEVIENGVDGLISNDENELREMCIRLLNDPEYARYLGNNAVKKITSDFSSNRFLTEWNNIFNLAIQKEIFI